MTCPSSRPRPVAHVAPHESDSSIRRSALSYFSCRDGRDVLALAGVTADPERMADLAVDLDARKRTVRELHDGRRA